MLHRRSTGGLALLFVWFLFAGAAHAEATLSADGQTLEDAAAGYRIRRPTAAWTLLPPAEARALHPDAVAGARDTSDTRAVLVVHEGDASRLGAVGDLVLGGLDLDDMRVIQDVEVILDAKRARRILVEGRRDGTQVGYRITLTARGRRLAEMRAWRVGTTVMAAYVDLARFERSVTLLPAFASARPAVRSSAPRQTSMAPDPARDVAAPSDRFRSGAFGFAMMPVLGWRLASDDELRIMSPNAEMGLVHQATEAYLVVLGERVPAEAQATVGPALRQATAARLGVASGGEPADAKGFGATISIDRYDVEGEPPMTFWHGVDGRDDILLQVLAWFPSALASRAGMEVEAAMNALRWLTPDERGLARVEESRARTEQAQVGPDWALRGVQYVDFAFGLRLRVRETTDWRLWAGDAADAKAMGARLVLDAPSRGCRILLIPDPGLGLPSVVYHQAAVRRLWGKESAAAGIEPTLGRRGETVTRTTAAAAPPDGQPRSWVHLTSFSHEGVAFQLLASGLEVNRDAIEAAVLEVLAALTLPAGGIEPSREAAGVLVDEQFGFRLDAQGLRGGFRDVTPTPWMGRGRLITTALGEARLFIAAYGPPGAEDEPDGESDPETLLGVLEAELKAALPETFAEGRAQLARRPATRLVLVGTTRRLHLLRLERGSLVYVFGYAWDPRQTKPPVGQEKRFELLP